MPVFPPLLARARTAGILGVACLGFAGPTLAQEGLVPRNHPAVELLRRLEQRGIVAPLDEETQPLSVEEVRLGLRSALASDALSPVEAQQLRLVAAEFQLVAPDTASLRLRRLARSAARVCHGIASLYENGYDLLVLKDGPLVVRINPLFSWSFREENADTVARPRRHFQQRHGVSAQGRLGTHLRFSFAFADAREWGEGPYPFRQNVTAPGWGFVSYYRTHWEHDETEAVVTLTLPWGEFRLGKMANLWGPGRRGQLALSENATSYDQLQLRVRAGRIRYTWLYGFLRHYIDPAEKPDLNPVKGIAAHRVTLLLSPRLDLSAYETLVFARRRWELAYLNPVQFYRSAEHHLGDEDNATLGFAFEFRPAVGWELYGELFLDDLRSSKIGTGWYGDKWAYLFGAEWATHAWHWNVDAGLEYARVRPYVYSHKDSLLAYRHFVSSLGHPMGPNADEWVAWLRVRPSWRTQLGLSIGHRRHGANPPGLNIGGSIDRGHVQGDPLVVPFLSGLREWQRWMRIEVRHFLAYQLRLSAGFEIAVGTRFPGSEERVHRRRAWMGIELGYPFFPR